MNRQMEYSPPFVLNHQEVRFETAQSWNKGKGNVNHPGHGNGGIRYPLLPYTGPHNGENENGGNGYKKTNSNT